jgi:DDE superfamily endonuclease
MGAHLILIPGGYTWKLQPMDIGMNKPFKDKIWDIYDDWSYENNNDAKPTREAVSSWIKHGWENGVKQSTIIKTWEKLE